MTYKKLRAADLHPQARGRWLQIFQNLCPGFFNEAIENLGSHVKCPFHGGLEDFRFISRPADGKENTATCGAAHCTCGFFSDGFEVLHRAMGGRFIDVLIKVDEYLNGYAQPVNLAPAPVRVVEPNRLNEQEVYEKIRKLWTSCSPLDLDKVPYYLNRGISRETLKGLKDVRFIKSLGYYEKVKDESTGNMTLKKTGSYPAIIAVMRNEEGRAVTVHRTWLSQDLQAKAPVRKAKKLGTTSDAAGAALRLFSVLDEPVLGLTEGIETAYAARELATNGYFSGLTKMPVWSCYSERNLRNFKIPERMLSFLTTIVIFADNDASGIGEAAANVLRERLALEYPQITVRIEVPKKLGTDWLDVLEEEHKALAEPSARAA